MLAAASRSQVATPHATSVSISCLKYSIHFSKINFQLMSRCVGVLFKVEKICMIRYEWLNKDNCCIIMKP